VTLIDLFRVLLLLSSVLIVLGGINFRFESFGSIARRRALVHDDEERRKILVKSKNYIFAQFFMPKYTQILNTNLKVFFYFRLFQRGKFKPYQFGS
jgi:hypothetical protein